MSAILTELIPVTEPQYHSKDIGLRGRLPLLRSGLFDSARAARARRTKSRRAIDASPGIEEKA
jgi:hypothetical protein